MEVQEKILHLLHREDTDEKRLMRWIASLEKKYPRTLFSNLLAILSNLQFSEASARKHWKKILAHKEDMESANNRNIDFRVALLDYFLAKSKKMKNPVVVEIKIFQKTKESSILDELTGLYNYRYFLFSLTKEAKRASRYNSFVSLLMLDVDNFKDFNDANGHLAGNEALKRIARLLMDNVRGVDIVARYGGEEFAVILPETNKQGAMTIAERIRKSIAKHSFPIQNGSGKRHLTVSGGVSTFVVDARTPSELLRKADSALYIAKSQGKNSIQLYLNERRAYARINASCIGSFWIVSSDYRYFTTKNLSVNGILFETDRSIPINTVIEMKLNIPTVSYQLTCKARVARVEEIDIERYDIGVKILEMNKKERKIFRAYVDTLCRPDETEPSQERPGSH